jgi:hypothetical protein
MRWTDFGSEWAGLSKEERSAIAGSIGVDFPSEADRFLLFRTNRKDLTVYIPSGSGSLGTPSGNARATACGTALCVQAA